MRAVEVAKQMIEKTKDAVREEEREKELRQKFEEIFGFQPEKVWWTDNLTLKAITRISGDELSDEENRPTVEGKPVIEVVFWLIEEKMDLGFDVDWNFFKMKEDLFFVYKWTKKLRKYIAVVEIMTRD